MVHFDPPVSIKPISEVAPGSIVRWGEQGQHVGFCVTSAGHPGLQKAFAVYDSEAHRFNWQYAESATVLSYEKDITARPDAGSFSPDLTAQPDGTLYTLDGEPHLIVALGNAIRFLNLSTGQLKSRLSWPTMGGYRSWIAGVRGLDNRFVDLLEVTPKFAAMFDDDGPTEPDEV